MGQPHPAASTAEQARQQALELADRRKQIDGEIAGHTDVLKRVSRKFCSASLVGHASLTPHPLLSNPIP
jgi:hypothetical protein